MFIAPKWMLKMNKQNAFTLIELLIVVAIIGILAAIAVPNFLNAQVRAKVARVHADHKAMATSMEQYQLDNNSYPFSSHSDNGNRGFHLLTTPIAYMNQILQDPFALKEVSVSFGITSRGNDYDLYYEFDVASKNGGPNADMYVLESLGPDRFDNYNSTFYPRHNGEMIFFDPSNGINSRGDILRAGGVYVPRWLREKKGGRETTSEDWI